MHHLNIICNNSSKFARAPPIHISTNRTQSELLVHQMPQKPFSSTSPLLDATHSASDDTGKLTLCDSFFNTSSPHRQNEISDDGTNNGFVCNNQLDNNDAKSLCSESQIIDRNQTLRSVDEGQLLNITSANRVDSNLTTGIHQFSDNNQETRGFPSFQSFQNKDIAVTMSGNHSDWSISNGDKVNIYRDGSNYNTLQLLSTTNSGTNKREQVNNPSCRYSGVDQYISNSVWPSQISAEGQIKSRIPLNMTQTTSQQLKLKFSGPMNDMSFAIDKTPIDVQNRKSNDDINPQFKRNTWNYDNMRFYDSSNIPDANSTQSDSNRMMNSISPNLTYSSATNAIDNSSNNEFAMQNPNPYHISGSRSQIEPYQSRNTSNLFNTFISSNNIMQEKIQRSNQNFNDVNNQDPRFSNYGRYHNNSDENSFWTKNGMRGTINSSEKQEKSRQSARDCRARKKIKHEYLEMMIKREENLIEDRKRQIENSLKFANLIDSGKINPYEAELPNLKMNSTIESNQGYSHINSVSSAGASSSNIRGKSYSTYSNDSTCSNWNMSPKLTTSVPSTITTNLDSDRSLSLESSNTFPTNAQRSNSHTTIFERHHIIKSPMYDDNIPEITGSLSLDEYLSNEKMNYAFIGSENADNMKNSVINMSGIAVRKSLDQSNSNSTLVSLDEIYNKNTYSDPSTSPEKFGLFKT